MGKVPTVFFEDIPQLVVQIVYAVAIGEITNNVAFAFVTSILSIVATLLSFIIDRCSDRCALLPIQYYLSLQCTRAASGIALSNLEKTISIGAVNELTEEQRIKILQHGGRRLALDIALSMLWEIPSKCIEIGSTVLGKYGARIHVVHFVSAEKVELVKRKYADAKFQRRVSRCITNHFELGERFEVHYVEHINRDRANEADAAHRNQMERIGDVMSDQNDLSNAERRALIDMIRQHMREQSDLMDSLSPRGQRTQVELQSAVPSAAKSVALKCGDGFGDPALGSLANDGGSELEAIGGDELEAKEEENECVDSILEHGDEHQTSRVAFDIETTPLALQLE